ncbi:hypothetical protein KFL_013420010 [Klebsormidium nitens]|uniref:Uncharacterized protein n=1 Tax=Klebsormidium nitens TaxID=105231 RepID=A0A1Y1IQI3_KLENI|nr:hypothetical protein KFL_013420010 [Klebsormidium nitens]|eukprot:GAQ93175.1 hypothetical protein KFL_013420010 [Klebsormidium nitens]
MLGSSSGGVTSQDVLNYEIFEAAVYCYAIDYRKVDPQFVDEYVRGKHAKNLMANFQNYERFVSSKYISTVDTLSAAVEEGEQRRNVQEYLEIRNRPANGINYAWCVLAKLLGIAPGNIDNTVFGSFRLIDGGAEEERALKVFDEEDFKMLRSLEVLETLYRPKTSFVGKDLSAVRKRNASKLSVTGPPVRASRWPQSEIGKDSVPTRSAPERDSWKPNVDASPAFAT